MQLLMMEIGIYTGELKNEMLKKKAENQFHVTPSKLVNYGMTFLSLLGLVLIPEFNTILP